MVKERNESRTHLASESDVDLGNATSSHSGGSVESAEFLDENFGEGRIGFKVIELVWMLQKSDNALEWRQQPLSMRA